jgi:hypothetical protein
MRCMVGMRRVCYGLKVLLYFFSFSIIKIGIPVCKRVLILFLASLYFPSNFFFLNFFASIYFNF